MLFSIIQILISKIPSCNSYKKLISGIKKLQPYPWKFMYFSSLELVRFQDVIKRNKRSVLTFCAVRYPQHIKVATIVVILFCQQFFSLIPYNQLNQSNKFLK